MNKTLKKLHRKESLPGGIPECHSASRWHVNRWDDYLAFHNVHFGTVLDGDIAAADLVGAFVQLEIYVVGDLDSLDHLLGYSIKAGQERDKLDQKQKQPLKHFA